MTTPLVATFLVMKTRGHKVYNHLAERSALRSALAQARFWHPGAPWTGSLLRTS
jgi:hypothetical protein